MAGSTLLDYLPAIYRQNDFVGKFLVPFEKLLLGISDPVPLPPPAAPAASAFDGEGLEQTIAGLARCFDPQATPPQFLPWLAGWVALTLRADWTLQQQRKFLAGTVPRYHRRGTPGNLKEMLTIFTFGTPDIAEDDIDHHFVVKIYLPPSMPANATEPYQQFIDRQVTIARAVIELEKPAHTFYDLQPIFPSMQIGVHSTIGVDTLLGVALY